MNSRDRIPQLFPFIEVTMLRTNMLWGGRIGGLAIAALAAAWATGPDLHGQTSRPVQGAASAAPATLRPVCGTRTRTDTEIAADAARVSEFKRRGPMSKAGTVLTITTYVHVLHDGPEGRVSEKTIKDQIAVLNQEFAAHGFRFEMAPNAAGNPNPDYTDNAAWFNDADVAAELAFKTALKEGSGDDLNIYVTSGGGFLGYAYYPTVVGSTFEVLDGVVVAYGTLPGANQPGISDIPGFIYNLGDTGTHEVGHYLGLAHTFEGRCSAQNDGVADTPAEKSPDFFCTVGRNSCKDGNALLELDPIHNFMDYSDDLCLFEFTEGQRERMNIQWALYRQGR
jgi:predicted Zn-dependent protease